jgi:ATP phosphoribosyltransferase
MGITGRDIIAETGLEIYELSDLGFGACNLVVAVEGQKRYSAASDIMPGSKVATEFPKITKQYFDDLGVQVEIIALKGAMEIAPRLGLAEAIVDLTSTGTTLEKNGLKQIGTILHSSARLICNKVSYKTKYDAVERVARMLKEAKS